jgi:hypothetical protein
MSHKLIPGSVWELSSNANCIPAGRYQFEGEDEEFLVFSVGSKIAFGLSKNHYEPFLKPIEEPEHTKTSTQSFMEQYAELFHRRPTVAPSLRGMTYCLMDSSLQRKFRRLQRQSQKRTRTQTFH